MNQYKSKPYEADSGDEDSDDNKPVKRSGRRKIKIEYIEDKNRRHITFSKRKAGIMKKAYELSTLTGTQVLLLVVSETGLVYTFTTVKLQPIVTKPEGKSLIQACLNAPEQEPQPTETASPRSVDETTEPSSTNGPYAAGPAGYPYTNDYPYQSNHAPPYNMNYYDQHYMPPPAQDYWAKQDEARHNHPK
ncbi:hypothetical protein [Absidia glauca]|uniref:MADS-box domain-containing protein n=1 Tax=Absidia glauca TaxID=4829 RepID=A0A168LXR5_ABSGL|nr:hypothetical protein [Absidia glauca]